LKKIIDGIQRMREALLVMKNTTYKFNSLATAKSFAARCEKAVGILMGDDRKFWVVCMADFEGGLRAGYEAI
jgi:hypothetical protein